jgi:hypothetical protein
MMDDSKAVQSPATIYAHMHAATSQLHTLDTMLCTADGLCYWQRTTSEVLLLLLLWLLLQLLLLLLL